MSGAIMTVGTVGDALKISGTGFSLVFLSLIALGVFITIISKVVGSIEGTKKKDNGGQKVASTSTAVQNIQADMDPALLAAIISAVSEETRMSVEKFTITSIVEDKRDLALIAAITAAVSEEARLG